MEKKTLGLNALYMLCVFVLITSSLSAQKVYATRSGAKYHLNSCRYAKTATQELTVTEALKKGLTACSVCKPESKSPEKELSVEPEKSAIASPSSKISSSTYSSGSTKSSGSSVQCSAKTKKGSRCSRMTKSSNGYCWQHGG